MKNFVLSTLFLTVFATLSFAQSDQKVLSPPKTLETSIDGVEIVIQYNAPSVRGRKIFGENALEPFGKVWRTGANEATTISFSSDVLVEGQSLKKGTYALFTIPGEKEWTIIFNTVTKQWGAYGYDESKDALRVQVSSKSVDQITERMEFTNANGHVELRWAKTVVPFSITAAAN